MRSEFLRRIAPILLPALALGIAGAAAAQEDTQEKAARLDPATLKASGKPVNCLPMSTVQSTIPAGDKVVMFSTTGNKWYRNDLKNSCPLLGPDKILVFRQMSNSQYCSLDMFSVVDNSSRVNLGGCMLGEFTPVTVPRNARF